MIIAAILIMSMLPVTASAGTYYQPIDRIEEFEGSEEIYDAYLHTIYDPEKARYDEAGFRYYTFEQFQKLYPLGEQCDVYRYLGNYGETSSPLVLICFYHGCSDNFIQIGNFMIDGENYTIDEPQQGFYYYYGGKAYRLEDAYEMGIFTDADLVQFSQSSYVKNSANLKMWTLEQWAIKEKVEAEAGSYYWDRSEDAYQAYLQYVYTEADTDLTYEAYWKENSKPKVEQLYLGDYDQKTVVLLSQKTEGLHTMQVGGYEVAVYGCAIDTVESDLFCYTDGAVVPLNTAYEQGVFTDANLQALAASDHVALAEQFSLRPKAPDKPTEDVADTDIGISVETDGPDETPSVESAPVVEDLSAEAVPDEVPAVSTVPVRRLVKVPMQFSDYAPYLILGGVGLLLVIGTLCTGIILNRRKKKIKQG